MSYFDPCATQPSAWCEAAHIYAELAEAATTSRELDAIFVARVSELAPGLGPQRPVPPHISHRDGHFGIHDGTMEQAYRPSDPVDYMPGRGAGNHESWRKWRLANHLRARYGRDYPRLRGALIPEFLGALR
jgi:hypothetical protein